MNASLKNVTISNTFFPLVFTIVLICFPSSGFADTYKWEDANGRVYYGTRAPKNALKVEKMRTRQLSRYSADLALSRMGKRNSQEKNVISNEDLDEQGLDSEPTAGANSEDFGKKHEANNSEEDFGQDNLETNSNTEELSDPTPSSNNQKGLNRKLLEAELNGDGDYKKSKKIVSSSTNINQYLSHSNLEIERRGSQILSSKVDLTNNSNEEISNFKVQFEFEDTTVLTAKGATTISAQGTETYSIPEDKLPLILNKDFITQERKKDDYPKVIILDNEAPKNLPILKRRSSKR